MNAPLEAVLFDYGNTLIAFGPDQQAAQSRAMTDVLTRAGRMVDVEALDRLRHEQVIRPYHRDGVENDFTEVCREIVELSGPDSNGTLTRAIMQARRNAFVASATVAPEVVQLLERLKGRYRLGLLSNYPCTGSIVDSLRALDLLHFFESVVVSADVGFAKPHPATYDRLLTGMDLDPTRGVYVGDNWLADVQGGARAGLRTVWVREHIPYETFSPQPGDHPPTAEIERIADLESILDAWAFTAQRGKSPARQHRNIRTSTWPTTD